MDFRSIILSCVTLSILVGCASHSPIDAKKTTSQAESTSRNTTSPSWLTDKDIFGNETTLAVSEDDIQAALAEDNFRVPLNSPVILVQSGNRAPEAVMQQEMSRYYTVAMFSGIPDRQKKAVCSKDKSKDENQDAAVAENTNWMQALRYIAAKGHQKAIIVYQETLQSGRFDAATKSMVWSDFKAGKQPDSTSLRYLVRFTLVDVASGDWATWSPFNYETKMLTPQPGQKATADTVTEQQIVQLKQQTYAAMVKDLVARYQ
ncbi:hypothetical protein ACMWIM_000544 [Citrobacter amalonaticus]|uniref:hypothetical protein n=1 Tax=Citrobacter amalonaticus TaxID=35703 RepID=UPI001A2D5A56|nr:hypothetical protein [Citrobacter amalonaticus]HAT6802357.1 hypothetical protein [Citrobacter freundii]